jgi:CarboxypepD_reg-like domain/TonB-dependent Receptor Plug Domain
MKLLILSSIILLAGFSASAQEAAITQNVRGVITDEQSLHPLGDVTITCVGVTSVNTTKADSNGVFVLQNVPIGRHSFKATMIGYDDVVLNNYEVTSSKELWLDIKMRERIVKLEEVVVTGGKQKSRALNEMSLASARQLSMDEAVRYSGTRNDPSRMAQNFAGVSGTNDARNDIVIRGNSPAGVLWRMDGIDIPNPNHFSTLGATGGPVSILNTNTLKNSDFLTSAFPAQYGNAIAGVFDLSMRNGNPDKHEYLGEMGFNGVELAAEGPISKKNRSSYLIDYRYSMVAAIQSLGLSVGTGAATPYYQDLHFKFNLPTKKLGTFSIFGLGGESHIDFPAEDKDNLYATNDGSLRNRNFKSLTGITGLTHQLFFNENTSGKFTLAVSGFRSVYHEYFATGGVTGQAAYNTKNEQLKYSGGYTFNKKINVRNRITIGFNADLNRLSLFRQRIPDGDSVLRVLTNTNPQVWLIKSFINLNHRFNDRTVMNTGVYYQYFSLNQSASIEPRWNIRYQLAPKQSLSFGAGLHSQTQPLEVYFYQSPNSNALTNRDLKMVKSVHVVAGYDINLAPHLRLKTEIYNQSIFHAAVEKQPSSFSMLNAGADFYFPDKTGLVNDGKGYNRGVEVTLEKFLHKGFYYLLTFSLFESKYKGSDGIWRNTAFNSNAVGNFLAGKEFRLSEKSSFGIDTKIGVSGGQRYTPFDLSASASNGYVVLQDSRAYSLRNMSYKRWDLKFSYSRNTKKTTQKWYIDFQNLTNAKNIYVRTLNPKTGAVGEINQIGFFPNINYMVTF